MGQNRVDIDRDLLRSIHATGRYQEYTDIRLRGFCIKVTPTGTISYTLRWQKPDGKLGRLFLGHYPEISPSVARGLAQSESATLDRKSDSISMRITRKRVREDAIAELNPITLGDFIDKHYDSWFVATTKTGKKTITQLRHSFKHLLGKQLSLISILDIEECKKTVSRKD